jgi:hypothetical protein
MARRVGMKEDGSGTNRSRTGHPRGLDWVGPIRDDTKMAKQTTTKKTSIWVSNLSSSSYLLIFLSSYLLIFLYSIYPFATTPKWPSRPQPRRHPSGSVAPLLVLIFLSSYILIFLSIIYPFATAPKWPSRPPPRRHPSGSVASLLSS